MGVVKKRIYQSMAELTVELLAKRLNPQSTVVRLTGGFKITVQEPAKSSFHLCKKKIRKAFDDDYFVEVKSKREIVLTNKELFR